MECIYRSTKAIQSFGFKVGYSLQLATFALAARPVVHPFKLSLIGSRTANIAAAQAWNGLPEDLTSSPTSYFYAFHLC